MYTVRVKYKLSVSDAPVVALVQGAYFFYQVGRLIGRKTAFPTPSPHPRPRP